MSLLNPPPATEHDLDILAKTLWAEARGEGMAGMIAAGWTIRNRVDDGRFKSWWGEGYAGVCQKPWQYSCWNKDDPNYQFLSGAKPIPQKQYLAAMEAAKAVIVGTVDPTGGATHYYSTSMQTPPKWAAAGRKTVQIGRHIFYTDVK